MRDTLDSPAKIVVNRSILRESRTEASSLRFYQARQKGRDTCRVVARAKKGGEYYDRRPRAEGKAHAVAFIIYSRAAREISAPAKRSLAREK